MRRRGGGGAGARTVPCTGGPRGGADAGAHRSDHFHDGHREGDGLAPLGFARRRRLGRALGLATLLRRGLCVGSHGL